MANRFADRLLDQQFVEFILSEAEGLSEEISFGGKDADV